MISELAIWFAYMVIPSMLVYIISKRDDIPFKPIFILFGIFIVGCGFTHLMGAIEFRWPWYNLGLIINIITAIASIITAICVYPTIKEVMSWRTAEEVECIHKKYEAIAFLTLKGVAVFNELGIVQEWNDVCERVLGYKRENVLGKHIQDFIKTEIPKDSTNLVENEMILQRADKTQFYALIMVTSIPYRNHKLYLLIFRDIDKQKRNEIQVKALNETLELRVQTLEQFNYMIAHDLNAPLRSMEGFSEILKQDYKSKLDTEGIDYIDRIINASKRMRALISDMIKLSRITNSELNINKHTVNLTALLIELNKRFEMDNAGRKAVVTIQPDMEIYGDESLIKIMLENLLSNAWKFTSKKEVANIDIGKTIVNGEAFIYIKDNGAGFDQSKATKLFKPFERLHSLSEFHGNGIGLTIVKRVVDLHNGKIWGEGVVGEGATFYFKFGDNI